jgi:tRNA dimethylallyltransferase
MTPILIIIAGPTAVGKSAFAIWLAQRLETEIISADSMQIYQTMDIGTAKPTLAERQQTSHHLIDLVKPDQPFSVADYQQKFDQVAAKLHSRGQIPLVVGGTGLYIRAVTQGFGLDNPAKADPALRAELQARAATVGPENLYQQLLKVDPQTAVRLHPNDLHRVIRALEVYLTTGIPISRLQTKDSLRYRMIYLLLKRDRGELYQRIDTRVDQMLTDGLIDEVTALRAQGYPASLHPMQSLGYKQINQLLDGQISFETAVTIIKQKTRNYAKRQLTWFHREPVDWEVNLSRGDQEFYPEILHKLEGRLKTLSNL